MASSRTEKEPHVLAIASHVTYGYVGNKMATFVLQALGCDVSAINTVAFSNHTAYKQFTGRKMPADEIATLYDGLTAAGLDDFDMLLSGYTGTPDAVDTVVLDPVMGDNAKLYVDPAIPPVYRSLLPHADLILPNAFEAETLTGQPITSLQTLRAALASLHAQHGVPHVVLTSLRLPGIISDNELAVVGSTARADRSPRPFLVRVPALPVFFSGTGDMFAALVAVRLREASAALGLLGRTSWRPDDNVDAADLPLATATLRALQSMHAVLARTAAGVPSAPAGEDRAEHLRRTKAAEIRVVRYVDELRRPQAQGADLAIEELAAVP